MAGRRVRRTRKGDFELRLSSAERQLLRSLGPQMRQVLEADDPATARLFPAAHPDDPRAEEEYRRLVGDQLKEAHLSALATLESSVDAQRLDEAQLSGWMRALNEIRLVLGTNLEVTEEGDERPLDDDDPRLPLFAVYDYLTALQGEVVDALSG